MAYSKSTLTQQRLKDLIDYDPDTGVCHWRLSNSNRCVTGKVAGGISTKGYRALTIDRVRYREHVLIWFYITGVWPKEQIDHKNEVRDDNKLGNLRKATRFMNAQNIRNPTARNKCGYLGVSQHRGRFYASIRIMGKQTHIGSFDNPESAHNAYVLTKRKVHEGCLI